MRSIEDAVLLLRQGEVIGVPTETVYGLAVDPRLPAAIKRLLHLKGRQGQPLVLLVASVEEASRVAELSTAAERAARLHWPGPLTIVEPWRGRLPAGIGDHDRQTVGLRLPNHPVALALLRAAGPLAVTSANRSGEPPALDHAEAETIFGADVAGYLEGSGSGGQASTVVDFSVTPPALLRQGPVVITDEHTREV